MNDIAEKCIKAREYMEYMSLLSTYEKDYMISVISTAVTAFESDIVAASQRDMLSVSAENEKLSFESLSYVAEQIKRLIVLPDPAEASSRADGACKRKPYGVLGVLYENVFNIAVLICIAIKTGNTIVFYGDCAYPETVRTVTEIIRSELKRYGYESDFIQNARTSSREQMKNSAQSKDYFDALAIYGQNGFIEEIAAASAVPIICAGDGFSDLNSSAMVKGNLLKYTC